jgi:hypothetical protein
MALGGGGGKWGVTGRDICGGVYPISRGRALDSMGRMRLGCKSPGECFNSRVEREKL